jgi:FkbM family methyltransferase
MPNLPRTNVIGAAVTNNLMRLRGHTVLTSHLTVGSVLVDAGAHTGEFSRMISARCGCTCIQVESNPDLAAKLSNADHLKVASMALGPADGTVNFFFRENLEAGSVYGLGQDASSRIVAVEQISLSSLMKKFAIDRIDLLKLDVEGAEFALLMETPGDTLSRVAQISVEFHDFIPAFSGQGLFEQVRDRLKTLGFRCYPISLRTHGDVLFLNSRQFSLGWTSEIALRYFARYWIKARELLSR